MCDFVLGRLSLMACNGDKVDGTLEVRRLKGDMLALGSVSSEVVWQEKSPCVSLRWFHEV